MPLRPLLPLLATALLSACATTREARPRPGPTPAWETPEGRLDSRLHMAEAMLDAGHPERAAAALTLARAESGAGLELDLLQARTFQALGMPAEAAELLEPHLADRRADPRVHERLGLLYFELDRIAEAEPRLRRAAELSPDSAEVANNLGFLLMVTGRADEAVRELRRAVALDPADPRCRNNLAFALAAQGADAEALQIFRSTGPEPLAIARLGLALERTDRPELAIARYHQALQVDPGLSVAREGLQRLEPSPTPEEAP